MSSGSKIIFTFFLISIGAILIIPSSIALALSNFEGVENVANDLLSNSIFILIQILVVGSYIFLIGNKYLKLIATRNRFWTNFLTIFSIYILLLISCAVTDGIKNSMQYGMLGFESAISGWLIYGGLLLIGLGLLNGLVVAPFMGKRIKTEYNIT